MSDQNSNDDTKAKNDPVLEIHIGRPEEGDCPTLLLDGTALHDVRQPYQGILHLEDAEPDLVVIFGFGLGYLAAGIQKLAPRAKIICWEPIEAMHDLAVEVLEKEWDLTGKVLIEKDPEDFQARLLAALPQARSLAVLRLSPLAEKFPQLHAHFDQIVRDVIDASTLETMPVPLSSEMRDFLTDSLPHLGSEASLASLVGTTPDAHWILLASAPDPGLAASIRARRDAVMIATIPEVAPTLTRYGLDADLILVHRAMPPSELVAGELGGSVLAITPDSHPRWWQVPARARFSVGHTATSWLMPENDPACGISFAWGDSIPLTVICSVLGAASLMPADPEVSAEGRWNRLSMSSRSEALLARCAQRSGARVMAIGRGREAIPDSLEGPRPILQQIVEDKGRPLSAKELSSRVARAQRASALLIVERNREQLPDALALDYLYRRARSDSFMRSLLAPSVSRYDLDRMMKAIADGRLWLEKLESALPSTATPGAGMCASILSDTVSEPIRVFIGGRRNEEIAQRVLESELRARCSRKLEVVRLAQCLPSDLPPERWLLEIPRLCAYAGHAIFLDASVLLLSDIADLWDQPLSGNVALRPEQGPASIVVIDCARFGREQDGTFGALAEAWDFRDQLTPESRALRFTCEPWHPWKSDLHPLAWTWEHAFAATCHRRAISMQDLLAADERAEIRPSLVEMYREHLSDGSIDKQPSDLSDGCLIRSQ